MKRSNLFTICFFLLLGGMIITSGICSPTDDKPNDCSKREQIDTIITLVPLGNNRLIVNTPAAKNNCEANYALLFSWANPQRAATDATKPPLRLDHQFGPADEFAYFPHPAASLTFENGSNLWSVIFDIGNRNSSFSNTRYGFETLIESGEPADSVKIFYKVAYTPMD